MTTEYYISTRYDPPALLRSKEGADEAFVHGVWRSTTSINDWMAGKDNLVDQITEGEAKTFAPQAFS